MNSSSRFSPAQAPTHALHLEVITIAWMTVEVVGAVGAGVRAHTLRPVLGIDRVAYLLNPALVPVILRGPTAA